MFDRAQEFLIEKGVIREHLTFKEAVQRAPVSGGAATRSARCLSAVAGVAGGIVGLFTILILTFYLLVEAEGLRECLPAAVPPAIAARVAAASRDITMKVSAWLGGQLLLAGIIGGDLGNRSVAARAFRTSTCSRCCPASASSFR